MTKFSSFLAAGAATFALANVTSAQNLPIDYDFQWAPMANYVQVAWPGSVLFPAFTPGGTFHYPGPGDSIRRCYSVDVTQGGRNESGNYEHTWFSLGQGFAANNAIPGVDYGLVSVQSASDSDLGGDACISPWGSSAGNTGGHETGVAVVLGLQTGTAGLPFPTVWNSVFQWGGGSTTFTGVNGSNTLGAAGGAPLLANVIFEIQGPLNQGPLNEQYYLGTTDELNGLNPTGAARGTGGVTNGNNNWGLSLYGTTADLSGAVAHTRITGFDSTTGFLGAGSIGASFEMNGFLAFSTPFLWAENNGSIGGGGPDWTVSNTPSNVQVWLKDIRSGAQTTSDVRWKSGGGGAPSAIYDPLIIFNTGFFLWSGTPAVTMQQLPMSWDDLGGLAPAKAGSYILSASTSREGTQSAHVNFDAITQIFLGKAGFSFGTSFSPAESIWYDGFSGLGDEAIWEGMFDAVESGLSKLQLNGGNPFPILPAANPSFAGKNLGVNALGLQLSAATGVLDITEVSSALTITLQ